MMLVPRRNSFDLFDDFFKGDEFFNPKHPHHLMKTDIKETKDKYIIEMDLPGYEKSNIEISLDNGYLEIAAKSLKEEKKEEEKYIHQERFYGECSRKFYVGDDIKEDDIEAEYKNGTLKVEIPKLNDQGKAKEVKRIEVK